MLLVAILQLLAQAAFGSEGDVNTQFTSCLNSCKKADVCPLQSDDELVCSSICNRSEWPRVALSLWLSQWDCAADCSYQCMHWLEGRRRQNSPLSQPIKYYGKWPFTRVLGMQEIASVGFSLLNFAAHAHNLQRLKLRTKPGPYGVAYPFTWIWYTYGLVSATAWLASAVFHWRDTKVTERLDYALADTVVAFGFLTTLVRIFELVNHLQLVFPAVFVSVGLLQHLFYMLFVHFDYAYNMKVCLALGLCQTFLWLAWLLRTDHPGRPHMARFLVLIHFAMLLEVLDFPPFFGLFDAHSLWHAATVPLTYLWYNFIFDDIAFWGSKGHSEQLKHKN